MPALALIGSARIAFDAMGDPELVANSGLFTGVARAAGQPVGVLELGLVAPLPADFTAAYQIEGTATGYASLNVGLSLLSVNVMDSAHALADLPLALRLGVVWRG